MKKFLSRESILPDRFKAAKTSAPICGLRHKGREERTPMG